MVDSRYIPRSRPAASTGEAANEGVPSMQLGGILDKHIEPPRPQHIQQQTRQLLGQWSLYSGAAAGDFHERMSGNNSRKGVSSLVF